MELKGVTWDHPRGFDPVVAASKEYAARTGLDISWDKRSLQAFADEPITDLAERYDFIVLDHPHVGQVAATGALLPLPVPTDSEASLGGSAESYVWNDQCWAYAVDAACQMAAFRPDMQTPRPAYWDDLGDDGAKDFRLLTPLLPVDAFDTFMTIVAGRGGEIMPHNPSEFVSSDNGMYALDVLRRLYVLGPDEQVDMNPIKVLEILAENDEFACSPCLFGYVNYAREGFRANRIRYFDLPLCKGFNLPRAILGGAGIGVSARTELPSKAVEFAQWITSQTVQSGVYFENNGQPAHRKTWIDKSEGSDAVGFFGGGFQTIDNAWTRPRDVWFLGFVDHICEIMPNFFRKNIPSEDFLRQVNKLYRHHLERA
ncbi:hypothetical protein ACFE33_01925 [Falsihalocynthiibacter sp. SS001]|uniref:hypothetical protein n=1 Tax=Falsihalocynthiibacter sp. SS001 TaxID=3349698 RepID=UPI0036D284F4